MVTTIKLYSNGEKLVDSTRGDCQQCNMIIKDKSPSKYPLRALHFNDLETTQKKRIIQILRTKIRS